MEASPHGNINFKIQGDCIINRPNSLFNEKGIENLFNEILNSVKQEALNKWVLVELLGNDAIPSPEAKAALVKQYFRIQQLGCYKVVVHSKSPLQKKFMDDIGVKSGIDLHFANSEEEAIDSSCK